MAASFPHLAVPLLAAPLLAALACQPVEPTPPVALTPEHGPMSGYYEVTLWIDVGAGQDVAGVDAVRVGGVDAYDVSVVDDADVRFVVQGAPAAGPADVELHDASGWRTFAGAFGYDEPADPVFERVVSLGASFSQGVQAAVPSQHAILDTEAARWDNVYVVDLSGVVDAASSDGIAVGDERVTTERFGGLVSLDGLHFADTGYAVLADAVIETVNEALGTDVPRVDLPAVLAGDPYSPAALTAAGLPVDECAL